MEENKIKHCLERSKILNYTLIGESVLGDVFIEKSIFNKVGQSGMLGVMKDSPYILNEPDGGGFYMYGDSKNVEWVHSLDTQLVINKQI